MISSVQILSCMLLMLTSVLGRASHSNGDIKLRGNHHHKEGLRLSKVTSHTEFGDQHSLDLIEKNIRTTQWLIHQLQQGEFNKNLV